MDRPQLQGSLKKGQQDEQNIHTFTFFLDIIMGPMCLLKGQTCLFPAEAQIRLLEKGIV